MQNAIVQKYIETFFSPAPDPTELRALLADDFWFRGPILQAKSADEYIAQLTSFGLGGLEASNLTFAHHDQGIAILYDLVSPVGTLPASEWFWLRDGKIAGIKLLNDPRPFLDAFTEH